MYNRKWTPCVCVCVSGSWFLACNDSIKTPCEIETLSGLSVELFWHRPNSTSTWLLHTPADSIYVFGTWWRWLLLRAGDVTHIQTPHTHTHTHDSWPGIKHRFTIHPDPAPKATRTRHCHSESWRTALNQGCNSYFTAILTLNVCCLQL